MTTGMWARSWVGFDLLQQLPTVVLGQVQVEQYQVGPRRVREGATLLQEVEALLAVMRDTKGVLDLVVLERLSGDQLIARVRTLCRRTAAEGVLQLGVMWRGHRQPGFHFPPAPRVVPRRRADHTQFQAGDR